MSKIEQDEKFKNCDLEFFIVTNAYFDLDQKKNNSNHKNSPIKLCPQKESNDVLEEEHDILEKEHFKHEHRYILQVDDEVITIL